MELSPAKLGKKKSAIRFDDLLCFARWVGQKTILKILVSKLNQLSVMV